MKKSLVNYFRMIDVTSQYMHQHETIWSSTAMIANCVTEIEKVNVDRITAEQALGDSKVYLSEKKNEIKKILSRKLDGINDVICVYGEINNNADMAKRMDKSASKLWSMRDEEFVAEYKTIISTATKLTEQLADYGINKDVIDDAQNYGNMFIEIDNKPRLYRTESAKAIEKLNQIKHSYQNLLSKLDRLMKIYQNRNSEFYAGYLRSRGVVNN
ncbi:MAG: hypothetical protein MI739_07345 [Bacteroidales bacterium]|nr:hypothetical protein [Bacteroidales bacterium]